LTLHDDGPTLKIPQAKEIVMSARATADAFTAMLKANDHEGAAKKFNAPTIVSIEAMEGPMARVEGAAAVQKKSDWWYANHTVHSVTTEGPYVNGDQFSVRFAMDVTTKETGQRMQMQEIGLYTVKGGKIIEERFFY
jgi:ketosteroid isomerase-like protein